MNIYVMRFQCSECGYQQVIRTLPYARSHDKKVPFGAVFAWCRPCGRVVESEEVPSHESLQALLKMSEVILQSDTPLEALEDFVWPEEIRRLMAWRSARKSPARCLECGTTRIVEVTYAQDGRMLLEHPDCGGQLVQCGLDYEEYNGPIILIDSEGNRIMKDG